MITAEEVSEFLKMAEFAESEEAIMQEALRLSEKAKEPDPAPVKTAAAPAPEAAKRLLEEIIPKWLNTLTMAGVGVGTGAAAYNHEGFSDAMGLQSHKDPLMSAAIGTGFATLAGPRTLLKFLRETHNAENPGLELVKFFAGKLAPPGIVAGARLATKANEAATLPKYLAPALAVGATAVGAHSLYKVLSDAAQKKKEDEEKKKKGNRQGKIMVPLDVPGTDRDPMLELPADVLTKTKYQAIMSDLRKTMRKHIPTPAQ